MVQKGSPNTSFPSRPNSMIGAHVRLMTWGHLAHPGNCPVKAFVDGLQRSRLCLMSHVLADRLGLSRLDIASGGVNRSL